MKLFLTIKNENSVKIYLKQGKNTIDHESLTINHNLDTLLIVSIDKLLTRNKIDRLSLKTLEIVDKLKEEAVSGMIINTVIVGFGI